MLGFVIFGGVLIFNLLLYGQIWVWGVAAPSVVPNAYFLPGMVRVLVYSPSVMYIKQVKKRNRGYESNGRN